MKKGYLHHFLTVHVWFSGRPRKAQTSPLCCVCLIKEYAAADCVIADDAFSSLRTICSLRRIRRRVLITFWGKVCSTLPREGSDESKLCFLTAFNHQKHQDGKQTAHSSL